MGSLAATTAMSFFGKIFSHLFQDAAVTVSARSHARERRGRPWRELRAPTRRDLPPLSPPPPPPPQRLANTKAFQVAAMKTVEMQRALQQASKVAADDPAAARAAVAEGAQSFWSHLKAEISRDLSAFKGEGKAGDPADAAKALSGKGGGTGGGAGGGRLA